MSSPRRRCARIASTTTSATSIKAKRNHVSMANGPMRSGTTSLRSQIVCGFLRMLSHGTASSRKPTATPSVHGGAASPGTSDVAPLVASICCTATSSPAPAMKPNVCSMTLHQFRSGTKARPVLATNWPKVKPTAPAQPVSRAARSTSCSYFRASHATSATPMPTEPAQLSLRGGVMCQPSATTSTRNPAHQPSAIHSISDDAASARRVSL